MPAKRTAPAKPPRKASIGRSAAAVAAVAANAAVAQVLFAATPRVAHRTIFNDSNVDAYVKYGTGASATDFSFLLPTQTRWDRGAQDPYEGVVTALWKAAPTGNARTTQV